MGTWRTKNLSLSVQKFPNCLPSSCTCEIFFNTPKQNYVSPSNHAIFSIKNTLLLPEIYYLGEKYKA